MKILFSIILFSSILPALWSADRKAALRYDFADPVSLKKSWEFHGAVFMVPRTVFRVENIPSALNGKALVVEADNASGVLMTDPKVDLRKNPVMRWRWRVVKKLDLPSGVSDPDDQVAVLYIGDGTMLRQKCIGYRWEHNTAIGFRRKILYAGGMMNVEAECIRNRKAKLNEWIVEERNVLVDFIKAYKRFPGGYFVLGVGANSQYSKSRTRVEIDYIEFLPRKKSPDGKK